MGSSKIIDLSQLCEKLIPKHLAYQAAQIIVKTPRVRYVYKDKGELPEERFTIVLSREAMEALNKQLTHLR